MGGQARMRINYHCNKLARPAPLTSRLTVAGRPHPGACRDTRRDLGLDAPIAGLDGARRAEGCLLSGHPDLKLSVTPGADYAARSASCLCRELGMWLDRDQWKVTQGKAQASAHQLSELLDHMMCLAAMTALPRNSRKETRWSGVLFSVKLGALVPSVRSDVGA